MVGAAEARWGYFLYILQAGRVDGEVSVFPGCSKASHPDHGEKKAGNIWQLYKGALYFCRTFKFFPEGKYIPFVEAQGLGSYI